MTSSASLCIDVLLDDTLIDIFARVAASSVQDIHSIRCVSHKWNRLAYHPDVLSRASLNVDGYPWTNYEACTVYRYGDYPLYQQQYEEFLQICRAARNPRALKAIAQLGLKWFFESYVVDDEHQENGLGYLYHAAIRGCEWATEWYGVILVILGGEHRQMGYDMLTPFRIPLIPSEVLRLEARWQKRTDKLWWRHGHCLDMLFHLLANYVRENCQCDGLTSRWLGRRWVGVGRFEEFDGMGTSMACATCQWHEVIKSIFRVI